MPIRMVEDDNNSQEEYFPQSNNDGSGNDGEQQSAGGGFGNALFFIPVIGWLIKRPKILLLVAALAAAYFFILKPMMQKSTLAPEPAPTAENKGPEQKTGAKFDPKRYDSVEVYAPLDQSGMAVPLPEATSLLKFAPSRKNQGQQGSCVAWSAAYAARTILEASSAGVEPNSIAFSPSYLYNQIHLPDCQGALLPDAMKTMLYKGSVPEKLFPYDPSTCDRVPNNQAHIIAASYKTRGFQRLTLSEINQTVDYNAMRQYLAQGCPVIIGMMVPRSFMQGMYGEKVWVPRSSDNPDYGTMGGHAMCVIGYDDKLAGGAFQIMNSWGNEWGENGIGWVRYKDMQRFNKEAYALYPLPKKDAALQKTFNCAIGMVVGNKEFIPIKNIGNGVFESTTKVAKGTKFKMYVKNELECYTYIFAEETNGASYTLFPYTTKHSPFCGITGVRLFPRDYSMLVDNTGTKDMMAVVVTKKPIDYNVLNAKINKATGDFATKVKQALGAMAIPNVNYTSDGNTMQFNTLAPADNKAVVCVVGINK
jgi:C1A family cysteine protease